jgi:chemotaxis protein methyltransferase CheR
LKATIIPEFLAASSQPPLKPFRAWSAACSTGEEAYSMAIVLDACLRGVGEDLWQIFASDISTRVLEKAVEGIYEESRVKLPNASLLPRYFQKGSGEWSGYYRVKKELREQIDFQHRNLLNPEPSPEKYDLIFCRNVMIYFDHETTRILVERLYRQLNEGGYLMIGHAESLDRKPRGLKQIQSSIFQKASRQVFK